VDVVSVEEANRVSRQQLSIMAIKADASYDGIIFGTVRDGLRWSRVIHEGI